MTHNDTRPIGVFDSGIGGLTVVKSIKKLLPHEHIIYFGDIARLPYGTKSNTTIRKFAEQTVKFLLNQNVKAIVIACNTISAIAKDEVVKLAKNIPILDVISAGSIHANQTTKSHQIGIIATPATVNSNAYVNKLTKLNAKNHTYQQACTLFVPFIEEGFINHEALRLIAAEYLSKLNAHNIDTLVLGCTHYPIIKDMLKQIINKNTIIIDPADTVSLMLKDILNQQKLSNLSSNCPQYKFFVTEISPNFSKIGGMFLENEIKPILVNID